MDSFWGHAEDGGETLSTCTKPNAVECRVRRAQSVRRAGSPGSLARKHHDSTADSRAQAAPGRLLALHTSLRKPWLYKNHVFDNATKAAVSTRSLLRGLLFRHMETMGRLFDSKKLRLSKITTQSIRKHSRLLNLNEVR